ncbi:ABC transporter, transmembrane domain, type 1 [Tolypocladium paradoxum]|uniref:ABC transporter, transmembrane domain, type 1 n=1 Tax=Tolypocladium paradoxum TaxID=94208 RepID=A0A2S4KVI7_9HYPO|nr:ABC transporter, transmembrane domain, type 1 [Tolypocladium paradoxum]
MSWLRTATKPSPYCAASLSPSSPAKRSASAAAPEGKHPPESLHSPTHDPRTNTHLNGKSSLILTLARLLDLCSGSIHIDAHSLSTLPRQTVSSRFTTLPQDAVQLAGTVRHNLDSQGLIRADAPLADADMHELGFSAGQFQLFCLARALLDEATSSVDGRTDDEVRRAIREEMQGRTVVEVAHRLELVRGCDLVVVMSEGRVQEAGHPHELLGRSSSAFRALWESQAL